MGNMKLIIEITEDNKDKIIQLINTMLGGEESLPVRNKTEEVLILSQEKQSPEKHYLKIPTHIPHLKSGLENFLSRQNDIQRITKIGSWGQFNSFFPIKASLRILANLIEEKGVNSIRLDEFVNICLNIFYRSGYQKYRGFPKSKKDTARGRFVWHFLNTAYEMGLIDVEETDLDYKGLPTTLQDWDKVFISLTREGLDFALLKNRIFDNFSDEQVLTDEERRWFISHLKQIDRLGYREYSLLKNIYDFLREGHDGKEDLRRWFENNTHFVEYVKSWSRKNQRGDEKAFRNQIRNLSITFAGSKVALLRELNVIVNKRNRYDLIGEL